MVTVKLALGDVALEVSTDGNILLLLEEVLSVLDEAGALGRGCWQLPKRTPSPGRGWPSPSRSPV